MTCQNKTAKKSLFGMASITLAPDEATSDVVWGAYLLQHLHTFCENCKAISTPRWRKGWNQEWLGKQVTLCNACGLQYNHNHFCNYCFGIYNKKEARKSGCWLTCLMCTELTHIRCENIFHLGVCLVNDLYLCCLCKKNLLETKRCVPE